MGGEETIKGMAKMSGWAEQCSKHLSQIEQRSMYGDFLGLEMVRQLCLVIDGFVPPPRGDWVYLLRKVRDLCTLSVRQLIRFYHKPPEPIREFVVRAMFLIHLYLEEAFRRCLRAASSERRRALCSLMVTMKNIERIIWPDEGMLLRCWVTMSQRNVRDLAMSVQHRRTTSIEFCYSFPSVMKTEMQLEVMSLLQVPAVPDDLVEMTKAEVRVLIKHNKWDDIEDGEIVPGREGRSSFAELFADEAPAAGGAEARGSRGDTADGPAAPAEVDETMRGEAALRE